MKDELKSHKETETWELVYLPAGKKPVGSKWVFKLKRNENDSKVQGSDCGTGLQSTIRNRLQRGAPVTRQMTLRPFLAIASKKNIVLRHLM